MKYLEPQMITAFKGYSFEQFRKDLVAGIIVGVVALPLSLAFAIAAGVSPEKGLITAVIFGFIVSLLGGTKTQIGGPTGAFVMIVASVYAQFGLTGMIVASVMGGLIQIVIGGLKLGNIFKYIPYPIMIGLNTGIAISIFSSQIKDALGLTGGLNEAGEVVPLDLPLNLLDKWITYFRHIHTIDLTTVIVTVATILIILVVPRFLKKFPPYLFAVVVVTVIAYILKEFAGVDGITTIGDRFSIDGSIRFNEFEMPNMEMIEKVFPSAITIAVMGAIVSIVSCSVADGATGDRHDSNMELVAEGIGNIVTPMFGGIPATGAVARTMVGISSGGRTPLVGIIHSAVVLMILLFLGSLAQHIPTACLAGMLVVVAYNMSNIPSLKSLMKSPKSDIAVLWTTVALAVVFNLSVAVEVSMLMAVLLFLRRVAETSNVSVLRDEISVLEGTDFSTFESDEKLNIAPGVEVFEIDGPFFFGMANKFDEEMRIIGDKPFIRILRMRKVPFIDSTGLHNLEIFIAAARREHIQIILSGVRPEVMDVLEKSRVADMIGKENLFDHINGAVEKANRIAVEAAQIRHHHHSQSGHAHEDGQQHKKPIG
ncbi:MAG: SulP family inorganic anion transporter [Bacteroidales bacterium]